MNHDVLKWTIGWLGIDSAWNYFDAWLQWCFPSNIGIFKDAILNFYLSVRVVSLRLYLIFKHWVSFSCEKSEHLLFVSEFETKRRRSRTCNLKFQGFSYSPEVGEFGWLSFWPLYCFTFWKFVRGTLLGFFFLRKKIFWKLKNQMQNFQQKMQIANICQKWKTGALCN